MPSKPKMPENWYVPFEDIFLPCRNGTILYYPPKDWNLSHPLPKVDRRWFRDWLENLWGKSDYHGSPKLENQHFEWDVQLSERGYNQLPLELHKHVKRRFGKNYYINVNQYGEISH